MKQTYKKNVAAAYYISGITMIGLSCAFPQQWICTIGFLLGIFITVCFRKKYLSILNFCILCLINRQITVAPLYPGSGVTLMALIKMIVLLFFFVTVIYISRNHSKKVVIPFALLFLWVLYRILNGMITGSSSIISSFWACAPLLLCMVLQYYESRFRNYGNELFISVIVGGSLVVLVGYYELFTTHTFFYSLWKYDVYRYGVLRAGSTLADPNFMSMVDIMFLCLLFTKTAKSVFGKKFLTIFKILTIIQIVLSFSRTAIIALAACCLMHIVLKKRGRFLLFIPLIVATSLFLPVAMERLLSWGDTNMLVSTFSRLQVVQAAVDFWKTSPLLGLGSGAFINNSERLVGTANVNTMNTFVQILVEYGIIGIVIYILYYYFMIKTVLCYRNKSSKAYSKSYIVYVIALFGWLIMSFSLDAFQLVGFWIFPTLIMVEHKNEINDTMELEK